MRKIDYYQITLHYWPQAVEANVPPQATRLYSVQGPQYYIPHSINFQDKPLRKDLIEAIKQTPWMATAYAEFLNLMELNPFPLVSMGNKSEDQDVIGDDGKCYGRIEVRREWLMANDMHQEIPLIPFAITHNSRRTDAINKQLQKNENRIKEIAMEKTAGDVKKAVVIFLKKFPLKFKDLANA